MEKVFGIKQERKHSEVWKQIKQNNVDRYHFLSEDKDLQVPDLLIDFKTYYAVGIEWVLAKYQSCYLATINELFREDLSRRFSNYLSRIGLPDLMEGAKPTQTSPTPSP